MSFPPGQDPRLYVRIHAAMASKISEGEYPAGTKLPILAELAARYGCGTDTAQKVLQLLEADGLAARIPGKGYYSRGP